MRLLGNRVDRIAASLQIVVCARTHSSFRRIARLSTKPLVTERFSKATFGLDIFKQFFVLL